MKWVLSRKSLRELRPLWLAAFCLSSTSTALADVTSDPTGSLGVKGCAVDTARLARLVRLELGSVVEAADEATRYGVWITCEETRARISLFDPLTSKTLERIVVAPRAGDPEPERLLALTVAQLYRASWLELASEGRDPAPLPPAMPPSRASSAIESAKQAVADKRPDTKDHTFSLSALGGFRARDLATPTMLGNVEIAAAWSPVPRWLWVALDVGLEASTVNRTPGSLNATLFKSHGSLAVEPLRGGAWSGFGEVALGLTVLDISSGALDAGYVGSSITGPGFEGSVRLGVAAHLEPVRIELLGQVGVMDGTPEALIVSDFPLSLDGFSTGLDLRLRWLL